MSSKLAIVGCGSIGLRHFNIIKSFYNEKDIILITKRDDLPYINVVNSFDAAFEYGNIGSVLVCNETIYHQNILDSLHQLHFKGDVLCEKPLAPYYVNIENKNYPFKLFVAYNLRFHPVVSYIKNAIKNEPVLCASLSVGQYLPTWHPNRDYTKEYSAQRKLGGGVLNDLSHEIDMAFYLFGSIFLKGAIISKFSNLNIDTEDTVDILATSKNCGSINIHMDYTSRIPFRNYFITTNSFSIRADLWNCEIVDSRFNEKIVFDMNCRDESFIQQDRSFLEKKFENLCTYKEFIKIHQFMLSASEFK